MNSYSKRGVSLTTGTNKTSRSMSTNTFDSREDLSEAKYNVDGSRNVKYVVNYKPKESQVDNNKEKRIYSGLLNYI